MKLSVTGLDLRLAHPWAVSRTAASTVARVLVIELRDASGIWGLGEAAPIARYRESMETVRAFLATLDLGLVSFAEWRQSLKYLHAAAPGNAAAKCAVATAVLDGAARLARQALHAFLGLAFADATHLTSYTIGIDRPEVIREKVRAAAEYPLLKMKVGVAQDRANLAALREVAPDKPLRVDANEAWARREEALEHITWLAEDPHVQFVEQPMPARTPVRDWLWLKVRSPLPIVADESSHGLEDLTRIAECFHGVNVKLAKAGGAEAAFQTLREARRLGLKTMVGCMIETSVGVSAAAHLASLCDYVDLDGNLLITNDRFAGVTSRGGLLSFAESAEPFGVRAQPRA